MIDRQKQPSIKARSDMKIAIVGGGVAGSTIALRFAELGLDISLIEKGPSVVNGPPICHLHAGGNLYREISDEQCLILLQQSIDTVKVYPHSVNYRPTVIALPDTDSGKVEDLLPRLHKLREKYTQLVEEDVTNKVLGEPQHYFRLFHRAEMEALAQQPLPLKAEKAADWMVPLAKQVDLDKLQFPLVLVQEYGLSAFRFAGIVSLAMERLDRCQLYLHTQVMEIQRQAPERSRPWRLSMQDTRDGSQYEQEFDYIINACGFESGEIDDMLSARRQRLVEFKAAYVAQWPECQGQWPEVIFFGERGTPQGMAQLTPYAEGYFQLHGMTQSITLFEDGLVASCENSAQPKLDQRFIKKIEQTWPQAAITERTLGSIAHMAQFIPDFKQAIVAAKPLYGAQQIPGNDPSLRTADVSFYGEHYARTEIIKASSALSAADAILQRLLDSGLVNTALTQQYRDQHYFPITLQCSEADVNQRAIEFARERHYPEQLAWQC